MAAASSSFVQRKLRITVKLAQGTQTNQPSSFAGMAGDQIVLPFLRASARIAFAGAPTRQEATVTVWGLDQSLLNELSTLGLVFNLVTGKNTLAVEVVDDNGASTTVFSGSITAAFADYAHMPDVPMVFQCIYGADIATLPAVAQSFKGSTDVVQIFQSLAKKMNLTFENNGVSGVNLDSPSLNGSLITQMQKVAEDANIEAEVINRQTLMIAPKGKGRLTSNSPLVIVAPPPDGQMIGYPAFWAQGLIVKTIFDPRISFKGTIEVRSSIKTTGSQSKTAHQWTVNKMDYALDTLIPRGQWDMTIWGYNPENPLPAI